MELTATIKAAALVFVFVLGVALGWELRKPEPPKIEPPAAAIAHKDGSITLERTQAPPPPPLPEPPHTASRTRAAILDLAPMPEPSKLQIDLVTLDDGTQRITAKGPGLIGGQDFPIAPRPAPPVQKWTLGAGYGTKDYSVIGLRNAGPWAIGGMIQRSRTDPRDWQASVILAIHF
jgi:hypothetical protein